MKCPSCDSRDTYVKDTRFRVTTNSIYRRRVCMRCSERFTTYEVVADDSEVDKYLSLRMGRKPTDRIGSWQARFIT